MELPEIRTKLNDIFRKTFPDDSINVSEKTTAADVPAWDSLSHINLILAVEKGFGIRLTTREVRAMANVGDFIALIKQKLG
jgi:acyl carrier protein